MYIQLTQPYSNFTKVFIGNINIFDTRIKNAELRLSFSYEVRDDNGASLFAKNVDIKDLITIEEIKNLTTTTLNLYDTICKRLLEYLIENAIETGTLEIK